MDAVLHALAGRLARAFVVSSTPSSSVSGQAACGSACTVAVRCPSTASSHATSSRPRRRRSEPTTSSLPSRPRRLTSARAPRRLALAGRGVLAVALRRRGLDGAKRGGDDASGAAAVDERRVHRFTRSVDSPHVGRRVPRTRRRCERFEADARADAKTGLRRGPGAQHGAHGQPALRAREGQRAADEPEAHGDALLLHRVRAAVPGRVRRGAEIRRPPRARRAPRRPAAHRRRPLASRRQRRRPPGSLRPSRRVRPRGRRERRRLRRRRRSTGRRSWAARRRPAASRRRPTASSTRRTRRSAPPRARLSSRSLADAAARGFGAPAQGAAPSFRFAGGLFGAALPTRGASTPGAPPGLDASPATASSTARPRARRRSHLAVVVPPDFVRRRTLRG